jgi:hypothetical protein
MATELTTAPALDAREFAAALARLVEEHGSRRANERCIECVACTRCTDCTFCKGSTGLVRCNYCVDSDGSVDSNHCFGSRALIGCTHCVLSERCSRSAYLERCTDCDDCRYCFGCVGLSGREFHILNRPYPRSEYFKLTAELKKKLR